MDLEEIKRLEAQLKLLKRKQHHLNMSRIKETDAAQLFKLEEELHEVEADLQKVQNQLNQLFDFHTEEGKTLLQAKVAALKIERPLGEKDVVNCNRKEEVDHFWNAFDGLPDFYFHYYFITSCATQMPHSFSERMIYEIIEQDLDENTRAILCDRKEPHNRVKIRRLPIGRNLEKSKHQFRKFFASYFQFDDNTSFDDYLQTGIPRLEYQYVALIFENNQKDWKPFFPAYFDWIITTFQQSHDDIPTFLFFFVTYMDQLHIGEPVAAQQEILSAIHDLASANKMAAHFSAMPPVEESDLSDWLWDLGHRNKGDLDAVIATLVKGLKGEDLKQYQEKQQLNMDDIERLQELVVEMENKKY